MDTLVGFLLDVVVIVTVNILVLFLWGRGQTTIPPRTRGGHIALTIAIGLTMAFTAADTGFLDWHPWESHPFYSVALGLLALTENFFEGDTPPSRHIVAFFRRRRAR